MNNQSLVISERIDDVVLLLKMMIQIGLPQLLTEHLPRHWHQKGLDWGWVAVIWLSYILSEGDHRKVMVREWVNQRKNMLEQVCGISIGETDFTDDRLGIVLKRLSEPQTWLAIETELTRNSIRIYDLPSSPIRMDATTMSGYHLVSEEGLFQWGHSKGDPNLPQIKVMMASLDPLGMPAATHVVSGENADDGLYIPIFDQVRETLGKSGLLWVGDCKMSALATRAHIHEQGHYYLTPLSRVGKIDQQLRDWLAESAIKDWPRLEVSIQDEQGKTQVIATGYELERSQEILDSDQSPQWTERVLLVHSPVYEQQQRRGLEQRLQKATEKLMSLTPPVGRGKRQIRDEAILHQKAMAILKQHRVEGLLSYSYQYHPGTSKKKERYQITAVEQNSEEIEAVSQLFGWRVYVTNVPAEGLSFEKAILTYRDEWIAERAFHRFKGKSLSITPFFVQREDQVTGLVHLLSLGLRLLTLIEFVVRRQLKRSGESLVGLYPGNPKKATQRPTTERLLKAFDNITLTILNIKGEEYGSVTPLNEVQKKILKLLGLEPEIYSSLAESPG
jgi:transposase